MSEQPKCDRCQSSVATSYDGFSRRCDVCNQQLQFELLDWAKGNAASDHPIVRREVVQVGQVWRKIFRHPRVVAGRLTGEIEEQHIDLVKRKFYRLIDRVTGETERRYGDAIATDLQAILLQASDRMVVEEFEAWVAVKDGEL